MSKATVWFMDARSRRFLESTTIKGRQILEHSGWLDCLKPSLWTTSKLPTGTALIMPRWAVPSLSQTAGWELTM